MNTNTDRFDVVQKNLVGSYISPFNLRSQHVVANKEWQNPFLVESFMFTDAFCYKIFGFLDP